ncbi:MAG TPA: YraN family protein [Solirubrobacteraceae bacterium]|jgi:putative endonuclease|nr:YraN family protein [Solirubrobacteraceae bacterium]
MSDPRRHTGSTGEQLAADHLLRRGFDIVERNFRTRWGELDIIAFDGRTLVFCEVKCRRSSAGGPPVDPLESVRPAKRSQVRRMAARWLVERPDRPRAPELRFDVIGVTLDGRDRLIRLDHLEAAF